jgi:hypothetical protein
MIFEQAAQPFLRRDQPCGTIQNRSLGAREETRALGCNDGVDFLMSKSFEQRNQTETARRKLQSLAKATGVNSELVSALANFTWDYDPKPGNESFGWVTNDTLSALAKKQLRWIAETVGLDPDFELEHEQAAQDLIKAHAEQATDTLWLNFHAAAGGKNYGRVSEFASHHYLRGLNKSRVKSLAWNTSRLGMVEIARHLFLKLFRGGKIERYDLGYLWCDLTIPLGYANQQQPSAANWLDQLLSSIAALPASSGLGDLLGCCKSLVGGDKFFKQEVLQSLAYADVLRVTGLPVAEMFIAEHRDDLSPHFYSNEWSFPLRFWSVNGGTVNREAIPTE